MFFGVNWLRRYYPILFDFIKMQTLTKKDGRTIKLKGMVQEAKLQMITTTKVHKNLKEAIFGFVRKLFSMKFREESSKKTKNIEVKELLEEFQLIFAKPKHLPPVIRLDHKISLVLGAKLVKIRPYRNYFIHKEEIEKLMNEMLSNVIIQHSYSLFASPILLVKKKDNT